MTQKEYNNGVSLWADEVYRFAVHCGGGEELSKDAVQEAYASLWECRERIPVEKGKAYLLTVAHNHLMSHHRREQVYHRVLPQLTPAVSVAPDERFDQQAAIELKDVEGYSCREIAEILSLTEKQVSVYLFRARVSLKKTLIALGYDNNN